MDHLFISVSLMLIIFGCKPATPDRFPIPVDQKIGTFEFPSINKDTFHDRVLGFLVGSAIGDAMGSPVEMWDQKSMNERYGFIDRLIPNNRIASAEGPWKSQMPAGTGTDDTRWKYLFGQYIITSKTNRSSSTFSKYILGQYEALKDNLIKEEKLDAPHLEKHIRYLQWLQEWAIVAEAHQSQIVDNYTDAMAHFYGGEMACAGLLYAPIIGLLYPGSPIHAYQAGWEHSIFDIGYAKDLSALSAATVAMACVTNNVDSLLKLHEWVDPQNYTDSRLIGRIAHSIHESVIQTEQQVEGTTIGVDPPLYFNNDSSRYQHMQSHFNFLNTQLKSIPFHAEEVYRIHLHALAFSRGNFMDAMVFITNYGRDNDTVAAITGGVLGAMIGYAELPDLKHEVVNAQRDILGIDLEQLAEDLVEVLVMD